MAKEKRRNFGEVIRDRRRQLDLTQREIARRIRTSTPYVGHLESGKRYPSDQVLSRLAEVLGLDRGELFLLANPHAAALLEPDAAPGKQQGWEEFRKNQRLHRLHDVAPDEMELLSKVARMGEVHASRDFIYILKAVRHALRR